MKRAFIADVDDTVCPSTGPLAPAMAAEIGRLVRGGRLFAFISGGTLDQISAQLTPFLDVDHHLLGLSGGHYAVVRVAGGMKTCTEVYRRGFEPGQKERVLAAFRSLIIRHGLRSLTSPEDQLQDRGGQVTLSALGRHAPEADKRTFDPSGERRRALAAELERELGPAFSIKVGGTTSVDITPAGVDKAWGIRRFLEHNHLKPEEALFFGDKLQEGGNDYPARGVVDVVEVRNPEHTLQLLKNY